MRRPGPSIATARVKAPGPFTSGDSRRKRTLSDPVVSMSPSITISGGFAARSSITAETLVARLLKIAARSARISMRRFSKRKIPWIASTEGQSGW